MTTHMLQQHTQAENARAGHLSSPITHDVCVLEIGEKFTTLASGHSQDNRIRLLPRFSATIELARDLPGNGNVISPAKLAELGHALQRMRTHPAAAGATRILATASASVSRAVNSRDIQTLAAKYGFEVELLTSQRECELVYQATTAGLPKRLVCSLRGHSCSTAWQHDHGFEINYVTSGYEEAFVQFIMPARNIGEACAAFGLHLKNYLDFLPVAMDELIITDALPCVAFIDGTGEQREASGDSSVLKRSAVSHKLLELQCLSRPELEYQKLHTANFSQLLAGTLFMDYLLNRTDMYQLRISDTDLSTALIQQHFASGSVAAGQIIAGMIPRVYKSE